ncbi:hypothetical protein ABPG77_004849 [Micractinium sp. CCAP 211/92]
MSPGACSDMFGSEALTDENGDNLASFLADLKSKYGLGRPPPPRPAFQSAAGGSPARRALFPAAPAPSPLLHVPPLPAPMPQPQVSVRVLVQQGGRADGAGVSSSSEPPSAEDSQLMQKQGQQQAVAAPQFLQHQGQRQIERQQQSAEQRCWSAPQDTSWMAEDELPAAPELASLILNPMFSPTAAGGSAQAGVLAGGQRAPFGSTAGRVLQEAAEPQQAAQQVAQQMAQQAAHWMAQLGTQQAAQQVTQHSAQQTAHQAPHWTAQTAAQQAIQQAPNQLAQLATQQMTQQAPHQMSHQATRQAAQQAGQQMSQQAANQMDLWATQQGVQQMPQQTAHQLVRQASQQAAQQMPQQAAQQMPQQAAHQMAQQAAQQAAREMPQQAAHQMAQQAAHQLARQASQQAAQQMPQQATHQMAQQAAQQAAREMPQQAAHQMAQQAAHQLALWGTQQAVQQMAQQAAEQMAQQASEQAAQQEARQAAHPMAHQEAQQAAQLTAQQAAQQAAHRTAQQAVQEALAGQLEAERAARGALQRQAAQFLAQHAAAEEAAPAEAGSAQSMSDFPADQVEDAATAEHGDTSKQQADAAQWAAAPAQHRRRLPWASLHTLLVQGGFPGIFPALADSSASAPADYSDLEPANEDLFQALHSLLEELARAAAHAKRLTEALQAAQRREAAVVAGFTSAAKRREAEVAKWKRLALDNQLAARDAQLSSRHSGQAGDAASAEARRLEGQVQQLKHQLRSKDAELERHRELLRSQQERDQRRCAADQAALDRLKRAYAASKAADTPTGAAITLKAAVKEMKPLDICRVFEAERCNLAEAAAAAEADAAAARKALQQAQEAMHAAGLPCEQFDEIEGQARVAARQAAAAEERAAQLTEEASLLRLELSSRPSQAQYDSLKRQADIMERQLAKAAADEAATEAEQQKGGAKQRIQPQRQASTRDMIQRDRNMQRLGLHCVEELPKPVLVEVVQDACALLECWQPLELCAAVRPVQDLAALVPRMERFIGDVCGAVFQRGLAHVPEALRQDNPSDIPAILAAWIAELGELVEMRGILRALLRQLASRVSTQPADPAPTVAEVVPLVASLVELERQVYHSREVIEAAETALVAQPEVLINRICLQFQRLFGCRSLEGVLPAMNKLYLAHTEAQTFLASVRTALGLDPVATLEACANRLEQLLVDNRGALASMLPAREPHAKAPAVPPSAAAVVVEVPRQRSRDGELQQAAQVAVERMAARRNWPQVEIFVPAEAGGLAGARDA